MGCAEPDEIEVRIGSREAERVSVFAPLEVRAASGNCSVIIHDLSTTGARIEAQHARFQPGEFVRLRLPLLPFEQLGEVVRTVGNIAGIRFCESLGQMEVRLLARGLQPSDPGTAVAHGAAIAGLEHAVPSPELQKRMRRADVAIGATCRTAAGRRAFVALIDLTTEGCCLYGQDLVLAVGQKISLQPHGEGGLSGSVKWSNGPLTGVMFDTPLLPFVFARLAGTYAWPLSEPAKQALTPGGNISEGVRDELAQLFGRAGSAFGKASDLGPRPVPAPHRPLGRLSKLLHR